MSGDHRARLARWFGDRAGPLNNLTISSVPWHSATFAGARYRIAFSTVIETPADALAECEIMLGDSFVADIAASVTHTGNAWHHSIDVLVIDAA